MRDQQQLCSPEKSKRGRFYGSTSPTVTAESLWQASYDSKITGMTRPDPESVRRRTAVHFHPPEFDQRLAARRYCAAASGAKTATTSTDQISV